MPWDPIYVARRPDNVEITMRIKGHNSPSRKGAVQMRGTLSPRAYQLLLSWAVSNPLRISVARDTDNPTRFALVPDAKGVQVSVKGRDFSGGTLVDVVGSHLRGGGYLVPLVPEAGALTFTWPPQDMREVVIVSNPNKKDVI